MAQGDFTKEEATETIKAVDELFKALPKAKQGQFFGHLNDICLFLEAAKRVCARKVTMPKHWNEFDGHVHCEEAGGCGYTLCGAALEGENGDQMMIETAVSINCSDCIGIIEHCQRVRPGEYVSTKRAQR